MITGISINSLILIERVIYFIVINIIIIKIDFGLSKILKHHDDILMTACGTPGYSEF